MGEPTRRILLAEDDRFLRKAAETALKRHGFTVLAAVDGEEALRMARADAPDLILLDLIMPKLQGFEVLRALKADAATAAIPVIVLSNLGQDSDVQQAMEAGAPGYIIKANLSLQELVERVARRWEEGAPDGGPASSPRRSCGRCRRAARDGRTRPSSSGRGRWRRGCGFPSSARSPSGAASRSLPARAARPGVGRGLHGSEGRRRAAGGARPMPRGVRAQARWCPSSARPVELKVAMANPRDKLIIREIAADHRARGHPGPGAGGQHPARAAPLPGQPPRDAGAQRGPREQRRSDRRGGRAGGPGASARARSARRPSRPRGVDGRPGHPDPRVRGGVPRLRHPHRAVRARDPGPVPGRRRAPGGAEPARHRGRIAGHPHQDPGAACGSTSAGVAQDGRFEADLSGFKIDLRVSRVPDAVGREGRACACSRRRRPSSTSRISGSRRTSSRRC